MQIEIRMAEFTPEKSKQIAPARLDLIHQWQEFRGKSKNKPRTVDDFANAGLPIRGARKGPGSVSYGIKRLQGLNKIIIDPARCPNAAREFIEYVLEQNKDETIKSKFPDKNNHTIDAARYALEDDFSY